MEIKPKLRYDQPVMGDRKACQHCNGEKRQGQEGAKSSYHSSCYGRLGQSGETQTWTIRHTEARRKREGGRRLLSFCAPPYGG